MKRLLLLIATLIPFMGFSQQEIPNLEDFEFICAPDEIMFEGVTEESINKTISLLEERNVRGDGLQVNIEQQPKIIPVVFNMVSFTTGQYTQADKDIALEYIDIMNDFFAFGGDNPPDIYGQSNAKYYFILADKEVDCQTPMNGFRIFDFEQYKDSVGPADWTGGPLGIEQVNANSWKNTFGYHPDKYLNIYWLDAYHPLGLLGGWSYVPTGNPNNYTERGIFMHDYYWNFSNIDKPTQILVHEAGHFFGLWHTFQGANITSGNYSSCADALSESNCQTQGDQCCDTPPTVRTWGCQQPCAGIEADLANFMSYSRGNCQYFGFSDDQINRMHGITELYYQDMYAQGECFVNTSGPGCTNEQACNYSPFVSSDDGSCQYLDAAGVCGGDCTLDSDGDGVCDDIDGCTDTTKCNYQDPSATECFDLDACGICNGPGEIYDCGCFGLPELMCNCEGTEFDFDQDGVCDSGQIYPPPADTLQVVLGDCPNKVDLVISIDQSGSIQSNAPVTVFEATKQILDYFYPAINQGKMRVSLVAWASNTPVKSEENVMVPLVTGPQGWSVLNNAIMYYNQASNTPDVGTGTDAMGAILAPYAVHANSDTYVEDRMNSTIVISDGGFGDTDYENIAQQMWNGNLDLQISDPYGVNDFYSTSQVISNIPISIAGILITGSSGNDYSVESFEKLQSICTGGAIDVYPAVNAESLSLLFSENLHNSICFDPEPPVCTLSPIDIEENIETGVDSNGSSTISIYLPPTSTDSTISDLPSYEILRYDGTDFVSLPYEIGDNTKIIGTSLFVEHIINLNVITSDMITFKVLLAIDSEDECSAIFSLDCDAFTSKRGNSYTSYEYSSVPFISGNPEGGYPWVDASSYAPLRFSPWPSKSLNASYFRADQNKFSVPFWPNGRYFISEASEIPTSNPNPPSPGWGVRVRQGKPSQQIDYSELNVIEISSQDIVEKPDLSWKQVGTSGTGGIYGTRDFWGPFYWNASSSPDIYPAEINLENYTSQFDIQTKSLKLHMIPYGSVFDKDKTYQEILQDPCGFSVTIPSCDILDARTEIIWSPNDDEYLLFIDGKFNHLQQDDEFSEDIFSRWYQSNYQNSNDDLLFGFSVKFNEDDIVYPIGDGSSLSSNPRRRLMGAFYDGGAPSNYNYTRQEQDGVYYRELSGLTTGHAYILSGLRDYMVNSYPDPQVTVTIGTPYGCSIEKVLDIPVYDACDGLDSVVYNGVTYQTVTIGQRCWLDRELRTDYFVNGDIIALELDSLQWSNADQPLRTKPTLEEDTYSGWGLSNGGDAIKGGWLYNWYVVNDERGVCPSGFHVSTNEDWNNLEQAVFNEKPNRLSASSNSIKQDSVIHDLSVAGFLNIYNYNYPPSQFEAPGEDVGLLGGVRVGVDGTFRESRTSRYWWTSDAYPFRPTEFNRRNAAWSRGIKISPNEEAPNGGVGSEWIESDDGLGRYRDLWSTSNNKSNGLYIRCVKD